MKTASLLLVLTLFSDVAVSAQTGVTVSGTMEDQSGAVIPGEKLTLTNKSLGQARETRSDGEGRFNFANVFPGEYVLRGEAEGFKRFEMPVSVHSQPVTNVRVTMPVSSSEEVVDVSASGFHQCQCGFHRRTSISEPGHSSGSRQFSLACRSGSGGNFHCCGWCGKHYPHRTYGCDQKNLYK
jgi:hypothetical protein